MTRVADRTAGRCSADDHRRRRHARVHRRHDQRRRPAGRRHSVRDRARQRVGARRARRPRNLALLLEDARRHAHRQPRRGHLAQLSLLRDARQLPRLARCEDRARNAGTSRSPISISSISRRPRPIIVGNHVIVGTGNDLDGPGFLQAFDPETGKLQWKFYTVPMKAGDPGLETWPNLDAARYGGGHTWMPGSYDPETRLYIFGTGNPTPAYTGVGAARRQSVSRARSLPCNVDTGKMAWHYQMSPHDTHDWDTVQNADAHRRARQRQAAQARVGRGAQRILLHGRSRHRRAHRDDQVRHAHELGGRTQQQNSAPWPAPEKEAIIPGALVSPVEGGTTNWQPPAYSPDTGPRLHAGRQRVQHAVSHRSRSARIDGARRKAARRGRIDREIPDRHRTCHAAKSRGVAGIANPAAAAASGSSRQPADCSSAATAAATSSRTMRKTASRSGTRASATSRTRRRPTAIDGKQYVLVATGDMLWAFTLVLTAQDGMDW